MSYRNKKHKKNHNKANKKTRIFYQKKQQDSKAQDKNGDNREEEKKTQEVQAKKKPQFSKVKQLNPASEGVNLIVQVISNDSVLRRKNLDGTELKINEALVGDETASIKFSLRNQGMLPIKKCVYYSLSTADWLL